MEWFGFWVVPYTQDSSPVMVFIESGSLFVESSMSWVYGYNSETKLFHHLPYNENLMRVLNTTSLRYCFAINWCYWQVGNNSYMLMKVQGHLMQACFIEIHQIFVRKKVRYYSNRPMCCYHWLLWFSIFYFAKTFFWRIFQTPFCLYCIPIYHHNLCNWSDKSLITFLIKVIFHVGI